LEYDCQQFSEFQKETWVNSLEHPVFDGMILWVLEMCCHFHSEVNLTAILPSDFEFNIFSFLFIPQLLSWRFLPLGQTWWWWLHLFFLNWERERERASNLAMRN
jgi:hypothetical protein